MEIPVFKFYECVYCSVGHPVYIKAYIYCRLKVKKLKPMFLFLLSIVNSHEPLSREPWDKKYALHKDC